MRHAIADFDLCAEARRIGDDRVGQQLGNDVIVQIDIHEFSRDFFLFSATGVTLALRCTANAQGNAGDRLSQSRYSNRHSILMPAVLTTFAHFAVSDFTMAANASDELPTASAPSLAKIFLISGAPRMRATSALSF